MTTHVAEGVPMVRYLLVLDHASDYSTIFPKCKWGEIASNNPVHAAVLAAQAITLSACPDQLAKKGIAIRIDLYFIAQGAFMDLLSELNPAQREAVEALHGPVLILAGPGSGKTRVLTYRIAYLVRQCGIDPYNLMAVTFTNKAAKEMRSRLDRLIGQQQLERLTIGTFHAICARILRREAQAINLPSNFIIYDQDDQLGLIRQALRELDLDEKMY
ncbi:MAG: UvrD-helicase domain-containing protein, partial [Anaerolineae bacterium]